MTNFEHDLDVPGARAPDPVDQGLPDLLIQWIRGRLGPRSNGSRPARSPDPVDQGLPRAPDPVKQGPHGPLIHWIKGRPGA